MKRFATLLALLAIPACSSAPQVASSNSDIVEIPESPVKNQAIGNCWLYATGSWVESLHKSATGETVSMSETYWSYWDWFTKINGGEVSGSALGAGGFWPRAAWLIDTYGYMYDADFVPADATSVTQDIQQTALTAIEASLATGALATPESRQNATLVRSELNKAFGLTADVVADLDATFGADASHPWPNATPGDTTHIHQATNLVAGTETDGNGDQVQLSLEDFIGTGDQYTRTGPFVWQTVDYPSDAAGRRAAQIRAQKAMNDGYSVLMSWYVDFNALDGAGHFNAPPATPGSQGGHMTVLYDYEITNVPGFGTLPAGTVETRPEALAASLDPAATISFLRTKNSWGNYESLASLPGYFDIFEPYFDGPLQECQTDAKEAPILSTCAPATPLQQFVVPAGY